MRVEDEKTPENLGRYKDLKNSRRQWLQAETRRYLRQGRKEAVNGMDGDGRGWTMDDGRRDPGNGKIEGVQ